MRTHTGEKPPKKEPRPRATYESGYLLPTQVKQSDYRNMHNPGPPPKNSTTGNGYEIFVQTCFAQHKRNNSEKIKDVEEFNKQCSIWWYNLPDADRNRFHQMATQGRNNQQQQQQGYTVNNGVVQNAGTSGEMATFTYNTDYGLQQQVVNAVVDNNGQVINYSTNTGQMVHQNQQKPTAKKRETDLPDTAQKKSGYYIFAQEETQKIRNQNPNLSIAEVAKELAFRWSNLDPAEKMIYEFRHQELRKQQGHIPPYRPRAMTSFKSHKKRRDPNAPKQPLTAFFIYSSEERQKVKDDNPTFSVVEVAKELGRRWNEISAELKQTFHQRADEERQKYDLEMAQYKQSAAHHHF